MRRSLLTLVFCALAAALSAGSAAGDGGPSPGIDFGSVGIVGPGGQLRYVAVPGQYGTVVEAIRVRGGRVQRWSPLRGNFGIPFVTNDGQTGGLSRDGKTLVLASYAAFPGRGAVTRFAVLSVPSLRPGLVVGLHGSFSYDALSPDASTLYAIQYTSAQSSNRYRVRAYDLVKRRLLPGAIVDKSEPEDVMAGYPVTRITSAGGAWHPLRAAERAVVHPRARHGPSPGGLSRPRAPRDHERPARAQSRSEADPAHAAERHPPRIDPHA